MPRQLNMLNYSSPSLLVRLKEIVQRNFLLLLVPLEKPEGELDLFLSKILWSFSNYKLTPHGRLHSGVHGSAGVSKGQFF